MSTRNLLSAVHKNNFIANDTYKFGHVGNNTTFSRSQQPIFRKKMSESTIIENNKEQRYTSRRNICPNCFETKSLGTGSCSCD